MAMTFDCQDQSAMQAGQDAKVSLLHHVYVTNIVLSSSYTID